MKNIGFIGAGSMGGMLIDGFIRENTCLVDQLSITAKTESSLINYRSRWQNANITNSCQEIAEQCELIFICTKPKDVKNVIKEINPYLSANTHLVSIAACVFLEAITTLYQGAISRVIPSLTSEVNSGISLICHNTLVSTEQASFLNSILSTISNVQVIDELNFEMGANLTSSAPGMFAALFQEFTVSGNKFCDLPQDTIETMVIETLYGTAKLLKEKGLNFEETISRVSTKGGITEEAVKTIKKSTPALYDDIFKAMLNKYAQINIQIKEQFKI